MREEYEEFWDAIKRDERGNQLKELIQIAAMCQRAAEDVYGVPRE